jgi:proteasome lid subunit RPN8/RPN11
METIYELETFTVKLAVAERELDACRSSEDAAALMRPVYAQLDADIEHFTVLFLNNKNRLRGYKVVSSGTLTASLVHPREVYRAVCLYGAAAVVFVHNHPSGDPAPSPEDIDITRRLKEVGDVMGVRVLDHVVLGDGRSFSFSDKGMMGTSGVSRAEDLENIRFYLWRKRLKRKTIAAALNCSYAYLCQTLQGYRKVETELDAIAAYLKISREHLGLLVAGKAPRTEPL